uniref:Anaphase-promoting complex subunit 4 WD40 domain-containing protein n=1 Tax=Guillardia theta TaxID=55529 RepID=A0A7S4L907_GUITH|mmetsp:Transcript_39933/g.125430  ORF Transcript_39933/g.125430 Transcript_39933/m.125430 type:complete len:1059 (+) Transcript_39933:163-3339(+)
MFVYLNKKIAIPNGVFLHCCEWNAIEGWVACGGDGGLLKILQFENKAQGREKGVAGTSNLIMNQTLTGHKSAVLCAAWNDECKKLTTSDEKGLIIVWTLHKGSWYEEMVNDRQKSVVRDIKWCVDGTKICICYADGAVIVGYEDGNRLWGKDLQKELIFCEWSPDARLLVFVTPQGEVHVYDANGNYIAPVTLFAGDATARVSGIHWYDEVEGKVDPSAPSLAIAFDNGRVQLMTSETDEKPILIDTGLQPTIDDPKGPPRLQVKWNYQGSILAIAGAAANSGGDQNVSQVQFYDPFGRHLRTLKMPGPGITGLGWEGSGSLRLAISVESFIYFANIRPDYLWGYFSSTLVYAFTIADRVEHCVVFFDTQTGNRTVKFVKTLIRIQAFGDFCVLATRTDEVGVYILILCNSIGAPVDTKYINIEPHYIHMTETHVVCADDNTICVWQYSSRVSKLTSIDSSKDGVALKKKDGKEIVWHVDESPNTSTGGFDKLGRKPNTEDPISCICANRSMLLVGRESGTVQRYSLPHIQLEQKYILRCCPQMLAVNCDSTKMSIIDINGVLSFFDFEAGRGKGISEDLHAPGEHLATERRDAWDMLWAEDNPDLITTMEKSRMYILRGMQPEEAVLSSGYLCRFSNLTITAILLDEIMIQSPKLPDTSFLEHVIEFETKSLRDSRDILTKVGITDGSQYIDDNAHPRLWSLLAEFALERLDLQTAEKAFVKLGDYQGIQLVKRLSHLSDKAKQRAEVSVYFKRFDEAEKLYKDMDRLDLAIDMRATLGDWHKVMTLAGQGGGSDVLLKTAYVNVGDYYFDRQMWNKAYGYFEMADAIEKQIECLYNMEDYNSMAKLATDPEKQLPEGSSTLLVIGERLASVGLADEAVTAFLRANDVKAAIDCCVLLNKWDQAILLAEEHDFPQIEGLLTKYATHLLGTGKRMEAIELYRKANRHPEAAKLLAEIAQEVVKSKANPHRARQLYILAALEVEKFREKTLRVQQPGGTTMVGGTMAGKTTMGRATMGGVRNTQATLATLDGLMQGDAISAENKILDQVSWAFADLRRV